MGERQARVSSEKGMGEMWAAWRMDDLIVARPVIFVEKDTAAVHQQ